jgi:hypothetical protein
MSIRVRLATAFTLAAAVLFALGAWLFVMALSSGLLNLLDAQLKADLTQAGHLVGSPKTSVATLAIPGQVNIQVFDAAGHLHGSWPDSSDVPLLTSAQLREARVSSLSVTVRLEDETQRLVAGPWSRRGWVVVAATSLATVDRALSDVEVGLVIAGVAVLVIAALGSYALGRAALSPVERLRREVAALFQRGRGAVVAVPRTNDEIAALAKTMNELLGRLDESLRRQRAFVADAGHELRTPFAVMQGELELASRPGRNPEEISAALGRASEEAGRLTRLANDLLLLARSDEEQLELRPEPVRLRALLIESCRSLAGPAEVAGVSCRVEADDELTALVDAGRLRQVVDNLLQNAVRFAPSGSEIVVRAAARGQDVLLDVTDSGPGFPVEFLPHAFERFSRPDSARAGGGAGLGLSIVQAIAVAHGGRASLRNERQGGATITLELPGRVIAS